MILIYASNKTSSLTFINKIFPIAIHDTADFLYLSHLIVSSQNNIIAQKNK